MGVVSNVESYLLATGKARGYTDLVANASEIVSVVIPINGLQQIFLSQNSMLDNSKLRAIEIITDDDQIYGNNPDGTTSENITTASLPNFVFTLAKDSENIARTPFTSLHRTTQSGKFYFLDSEAGSHRIGDSSISQVGAGAYNGYIITLRFWYNRI
tara:strand:- start:779 stop:1249 length:471 start_codon:yes stop_codon:yes gene_type:complete